MRAETPKLGGMAIDSPLRRWRKANGYTQEQLADLVGAHLDSVNRWEQGRRAPHPRSLARLMAITSLPSDAIIFPTRYLQLHPEYLARYAETPPRRGRPPGWRRPEEGQP
jgi:transcriptional regulator with XRE-family HTH domain